MTIPARVSWFTPSESFYLAHSHERDCVMKFSFTRLPSRFPERLCPSSRSISTHKSSCRCIYVDSPSLDAIRDLKFCKSVFLWLSSEQFLLSLMVTCISFVKYCVGPSVIFFCWIICFFLLIYSSSLYPKVSSLLARCITPPLSLWLDFSFL